MIPGLPAPVSVMPSDRVPEKATVEMLATVAGP
jgi:hypothetical protein